MGVSIDELVGRHPFLWHMAERGSWPSITRHGLRSTTALLDLFEYSGEKRRAIESRKRGASVSITHPRLGTAVIRDNLPINETVLERTLVGYSLQEWYQELNGRVFFWLSEERLGRLKGAAAYRERKHLVLKVDTRMLLERHIDSVELSTLNSGAVHAAANYERGEGTFASLAEYRWAERLRSHPREPAVELTVNYSVPDITELVVERREY